MTQPTAPGLHPSKDPRQSVNAFARLLARLAHPFINRVDELAQSALVESELEALTQRWSVRMQADPAAIALYEAAYAAEKEHLVAGQAQEDGSQERASRLDPARRSEAVLSPLVGEASDANETLPFATPVVEALPFQAGFYHPSPPLARVKQARRRDDDPDATRLPISNPDATLPFAGVPRVEKKPTKR